MKKRVFLAIPVNHDFISGLETKLKELGGLPVKFIPSENWHLTLIFLGWLKDKEIQTIQKIAEEASRKFPTFVLRAKNIVLFPKNRPRMIWLNFYDNKIFNELTIWLDSEFKKTLKNYKPLSRGIRIHLTLARFKVGRRFAFSSAGFEKKFKADKIQIMESKLSRGGAVYNLLGEYKLKQ